MTTKTNGAAKWHKAKLVNPLHNLAGEVYVCKCQERKKYFGAGKAFLSHLKHNTRIFFLDILHNFTRCTFTAPRQLQAILATIEQRRHQPEPNFGRSEHNPRSITATDQVIPDLASHAWHWFGCQIHWCWCCNSRCRWFRCVLDSTLFYKSIILFIERSLIARYAPSSSTVSYNLASGAHITSIWLLQKQLPREGLRIGQSSSREASFPSRKLV